MANTPQRNIRVDDDTWAKIGAVADEHGQDRTEYLLDLHRAAVAKPSEVLRLRRALEEVGRDLVKLTMQVAAAANGK